jgi:hypothetical protein
METKTILSIPDDVFAAAEVLAYRLGLSRGALYARAVAEFVEIHRRCGVAESWDAVQLRVSTTSTEVDGASMPG